MYAQLEVDLGRAEDAILRLLARARAHGADPELSAGLVQALAALNAKAREWDRANRLLFRNSGGEAVLGAVESAVMPIP